MLLVCDTNVLISAFLFPGGAPDKIVRAILAKRFEHATSPDILTEFRQVLSAKFKLSDADVASLIQLVADNSRLCYPVERLNVITVDPPDNRILECGVAATADVIVSGDKRHLLPLKSFMEMPLVSPAEFARQHQIV